MSSTLRKRIGMAIAMSAALVLAGACATATDRLYSGDRLTDITATHLGVDPSSIEIYDKRATATGTYYNVRFRDGRTARCFHDGNAFGFGLFANPPRCGDNINNIF